MKQSITLSRMRIPMHIGVPDEERRFPQILEVSLTLYPSRSLFGTHDEIENTINYYEVSEAVRGIAQSRPRKLIEQLNEDILEALLESYPLERVDIQTHKFILENTQEVSVQMSLCKE